MVRVALIVEDERETGNLLAEILRRKGFEPTILAEGKPVISWIRLHQPELILLDLMLPDVDGYDICADLKLDRDTNLIPIVMVTARDQPQDRIHGLQVGANQYLTKPFTVEQLTHAIDSAFAWREELERTGTAGEVHFEFNSDTKYLEELNHLLGSLCRFSGLSSEQIRQLATAVREVGTNAIEWGHNHQVERIVTVTYRIDPEKIALTVRDTGPGFDPQNVPHAARDEDPVSHMMVRESLGMRDGGFGMMMARGLVDEMQYNEKGNEVRLVKYFSAPQAMAGQKA